MKETVVETVYRVTKATLYDLIKTPFSLSEFMENLGIASGLLYSLTLTKCIDPMEYLRECKILRGLKEEAITRSDKIK